MAKQRASLSGRGREVLGASANLFAAPLASSVVTEEQNASKKSPVSKRPKRVEKPLSVTPKEQEIALDLTEPPPIIVAGTLGNKIRETVSQITASARKRPPAIQRATSVITEDAGTAQNFAHSSQAQNTVDLQDVDAIEVPDAGINWDAFDVPPAVEVAKSSESQPPIIVSPTRPTIFVNTSTPSAFSTAMPQLTNGLPESRVGTQVNSSFVNDAYLADEILAATPPANSPQNVRSPLPPIDVPLDEPAAVGMAVTSVETQTPEPQPPGGPAPARIRVGGLVLETPNVLPMTPPGPGMETQPNSDETSLTLREITDEEARRIMRRVSAEQERALARDIDRLYDRVAEELSNDPSRAERALQLLHQSRIILIEKPENFVDAEYQVQRVVGMLTASINSRRWAAAYGARVFIYETSWMAGLLFFYMALSFFWPTISGWLMKVGNLPADSLMLSQAMPFASTLLWGGLGATIGALWSLWYHISERRDFDREFVMWYLTQPVMGIVLGGIVYLLFGAGLLVLQVNTSESLGVRLLPALIAAVGGFRQNFVYEQMGRLVELLSGRGRPLSDSTESLP